MEVRRIDIPFSHFWVINYPAKIYYSLSSVGSSVGFSWACSCGQFHLEVSLSRKSFLIACLEVGAGCRLGCLDSPSLALSPSKRLTQPLCMVVLGQHSKSVEADAVRTIVGGAKNSRSITSAQFYWPKQVTGPVQI